MKHLKITVDGRVYDVMVEELNDEDNVVETDMQKSQSKTHIALDGEPIKAPMSGNIVSVNVTEGQIVKKGDMIVLLEAMKMENEILAPKDGKIISLQVSKGQNVTSNQVIAILK